MHRSIFSIALLLPLVAACAATFPRPVQRLANAQSATRSAAELGAGAEPSAQLSLKLAYDQISEAEKAMAAGDNQRADHLLIRAEADAELAIAQAREHDATADRQDAIDESAAQKSTNISQGATE